ncbi:hypothetical protein C0992_003228, partial [Termitomyces sp. T32_za158]
MFSSLTPTIWKTKKNTSRLNLKFSVKSLMRSQDLKRNPVMKMRMRVPIIFAA